MPAGASGARVWKLDRDLSNLLAIIKRFDYNRDVPTVLYADVFRFFFYSNERNEPAHIHVEHQEGKAKFWLAPVRLAYAKRFRPSTITKLFSTIRANESLFLEKWNEHFTPELE